MPDNMPTKPLHIISINPATCQTGNCPQSVAVSGTGFKSNMLSNMGTLSRISANKATLTLELQNVGTYCIYFSLPNGTVSNTVCIVVGAATAPVPPSIPTDVTAVAGNTTVSLSWAAVTNATSYVVARSTTSGAEAPLATVTARVYNDTGLTNGTTYYYTITAQGPGGSSPHSNEVSAQPYAVVVPPDPLAAPTGLTAIYTVGQIALSWTASAGAASYKVKRSTSSGTETTLVTGNVPTTYTDTAIVAGNTYYYKVSAYDGTDSANSNEAFATYPPVVIPPPTAPTNLHTTAITTSQIDLAWTDTASDMTGFQLERCMGTGCTGFVSIAVLGPTIRAYSDTGLSQSTIYRYRIKAVNGFASSAYSAIIAATTSTPATANTYYVATTGNDSNDGTINAPFLTISKGVSVLSAGKTLYIRAGIYTGSANVIDSQTTTMLSGTSGSRITIAGYPSETVIIQPPDGTAAIRLTTGGPSYLTIQDIVCDGVNQITDVTGQLVYMAGGSSRNIVQRVEVKNGNNFGIQVTENGGAASFNQFLQCLIHDNGTLGMPNTNGHGFYMGARDNIIDGCTVYNNKGMGIQLNGADGALDRSIVRNNRCYDNAVRTTTTGVNITVAHGTDILIYNNLSYQTDGRTNLEGIQVYTNTFNCQVLNNTVYGFFNWDGIHLEYYGSAPVLRNNIVYGCSTAIHDYGGTGTPVQSNNLTTNPLFVDAAAANFHLQSTSPAINAGATLSSVTTDFEGNARPLGAAYDIGAYEYLGVAPPVPSAPTGLTAEVISTSQVNLAWTDTASDMTGFVVERCSGTSCTSFTSIAVLDSLARAFSDTTVNLNVTPYRYRVKAFNGATSSAYSSIVTASAIAVTTSAGLQAAINAAVFGDTILLAENVSLIGQFSLPNKGPGSSYITIRTDNSSTYPAEGVRVTTANTGMAKIVSNITNQPLFAEPGAHHYKFIGVEIATSYTGESFYLYIDGYTDHNLGTQISDAAQMPHHIEFDRVWAHATPTSDIRHGICLNGAYQTVKNSLINEIHSANGDANGICGWNGSGPYVITNNRIEASAENIVFGGASSGIPNVQPADFTIQYNYLTKPLEWYSYCVTGSETGCNGHTYDGSSWIVKNCWEMKTGVRILFDHNICEHSWSQGQDGNIILLQLINQTSQGNVWNKLEDVTITNNILRHGNRALVLASHVLYGGTTLNYSANNITFRNNLCYDINGAVWGNLHDLRMGQLGGFGCSSIGPLSNITLDHNTVDNTLGVDQPLGLILASSGGLMPGLTIKNNFWRGNGTYGPLWADGYIGTTALNTYAPGTYSFLQNVLSTSDLGQTFPPTTSLLTDTALLALWPNRASANYTLTPGGPYAAGGVNDATDGTNVGVNMYLLPDPAGDGNTTFTG